VAFDFRTAAMTKAQCFWDVALCLLFFLDYTDPEDGVRKLLRDVGNYLPIETAAYSRTIES
jgi:hypothetical protein